MPADSATTSPTCRQQAAPPVADGVGRAFVDQKHARRLRPGQDPALATLDPGFEGGKAGPHRLSRRDPRNHVWFTAGRNHHIGAGIDEDFDPERVRYHKVILMSDADVDGAHIRTLLLTFFFRHMRKLVDAGHLYIAQPPLYRIKSSEGVKWVYTEQEKDDTLKDWDPIKKCICYDGPKKKLEDMGLYPVAKETYEKIIREK